MPTCRPTLRSPLDRPRVMPCLRRMSNEFQCALWRHVAFDDDHGEPHRGFIISIDSHPDEPTVDVECADAVWKHVPVDRMRPDPQPPTFRPEPKKGDGPTGPQIPRPAPHGPHPPRPTGRHSQRAHGRSRPRRPTNRHEIPTQRIRTRLGPRQTHRQPHPHTRHHPNPPTTHPNQQRRNPTTPGGEQATRTAHRRARRFGRRIVDVIAGIPMPWNCT